MKSGPNYSYRNLHTYKFTTSCIILIITGRIANKINSFGTGRSWAEIAALDILDIKVLCLKGKTQDYTGRISNMKTVVRVS